MTKASLVRDARRSQLEDFSPAHLGSRILTLRCCHDSRFQDPAFDYVIKA